MPKTKASDPITDQEIAFAHLVLSGAMTDRQAAQAVGLNPDSAAHTKSKPHVRAYMLQHRAAVQQQPPPALDREQVLNRLWEIAHLRPEMTRGSVTSQVKCLSMIIAMENFIPDRRAVASQQKSTPAPTPQIYQSAWLRGQQATTTGAEPSSDPAQEEAQQEASPVPNPNFAHRVPLADGRSPYVPLVAPDTRVPFSIKKNPFARRPR